MNILSYSLNWKLLRKSLSAVWFHEPLSIWKCPSPHPSVNTQRLFSCFPIISLLTQFFLNMLCLLDAKIKFIIVRKIYYILEYLSFIFHSCAQDEQEGNGCEKSGNVPKLSLQGKSVPATSIRHRQQKKTIGEPHLKTSYLQNIRISSNQAWDHKKHTVCSTTAYSSNRGPFSIGKYTNLITPLAG